MSMMRVSSYAADVTDSRLKVFYYCDSSNHIHLSDRAAVVIGHEVLLLLLVRSLFRHSGLRQIGGTS